ncbi:hypothetical protein Phum_PHUM434680, partial [Pediculus humanus corporis]
ANVSNGYVHNAHSSVSNYLQSLLSQLGGSYKKPSTTSPLTTSSTTEYKLEEEEEEDDWIPDSLEGQLEDENAIAARTTTTTPATGSSYNPQQYPPVYEEEEEDDWIPDSLEGQLEDENAIAARTTTTTTTTTTPSPALNI